MIALAIVCAVANAQNSEGLKGADAVIADARKPLPSPFLELRAEINAVAARDTDRGPQARADQWLALLQRLFQVGNNDWRAQGPDGLNLIFRALPAPESWPLIRARLDRLPASEERNKLTVVFDVLLGRYKPALAECESLSNRSGLASIKLDIALHAHDEEVTEQLLPGSPSEFPYRIPDVAAYLDPNRVRPWLKAILVKQARRDLVIDGQATRRLAREIVLSDPDNMPTTSWSVLRWPDDLSVLSSWTERRLNQATQVDAIPPVAFNAYVDKLMQQGKVDEAEKLASDFDFPFAHVGYDATPGPSWLNRFFDAYLRESKALPRNVSWDNFGMAGKQLGRVEVVIKALREARTRPDCSSQFREHIDYELAKLLAESGEEYASIEAYADILPTESRQEFRGRTQVVQDIAPTASASVDPKVLALYARIAKGAYDPPPIEPWLRQGQTVAAQRFVVESAQIDPIDRSPSPYSRFDRWLPQLARIYFAANRPADLAKFLDGFSNPQWDDLSRYLTERDPLRGRHVGNSLGYMAAWAFAKTGRKPLAIKILRALLQMSMDEDDAYALLVDLEGRNALSFFDELQRLDPYSSRPAMWKADLLLRQGKLQEAESLARRSYSLDPIDKNALPGHRLQSLVVLARTLRAEGKTAEARKCEVAVEAARIGERADPYRLAGLLPQALPLYRQAVAKNGRDFLLRFHLAYCLQELGQSEPAFAECRRAFALMPADTAEAFDVQWDYQSFFIQAELRDIARPLFLRMLQENPRSPAVTFLLAEVYRVDGNEEKALELYQATTNADPRFVSAWVRIAERGNLKERQDAEWTLLRLDPLKLHRLSAATNDIWDFPALWRAYRTVSNSFPPPPAKSLFPIGPPQNIDEEFFPGYSPTLTALRRGPGAAIAAHDLIRRIIDLRP